TTIVNDNNLTPSRRSLCYYELVKLLSRRLKTLENTYDYVILFCKQLSSTIEQLCSQKDNQTVILNDIINGVTNGILIFLADTTAVSSMDANEPSIALASVIDLLHEQPNINILDSFILTIDDERLLMCLNRLGQLSHWACSTTKPSQWLVSIWTLLLQRERSLLVADSACSVIPGLIESLDNLLCVNNVIVVLCWILVNQPHHLLTFGETLRKKMSLLFDCNANIMLNTEFLNLIESCRYALNSLIDEQPTDIDSLKSLLQTLPRSKQSAARDIRLLKCQITSISSSSNSIKIRTHDKVGLVNIGNTCYLNAIVQALYACTEFRNNLLSIQPSANNELLKSLQNLFGFLALSHRPIYHPEKFWLQAKPVYFERNHQQDCQEFLRHLLDSLHEEAKKQTNELVKRHLMGTMVHVCKCSNCSQVTQSRDPFYEVSIGLNDGTNSVADTDQGNFELQSLIDHMFDWEQLVGDDQYACETCGQKQDATRRMFITSYPNYLVLLLKRFIRNKLTGKYEKCLAKTTLPMTITLPTTNEPVTYRLIAIVIHHGLSMNSGHYYSFVLHNDIWWLFNDTHVESLSFDSVCKHFEKFSSASPYVIMYEKQKNETEPIAKPIISSALQSTVDRDNAMYSQEQVT
ncbi:unnamed protein product, partial [Didymodactylos carnosus]